MDKYITIELYTLDGFLQVVSIPILCTGVESTINSTTEFICNSLDDKEAPFIAFVGKYESVIVKKKDINKIIINGKGVL